jgi:hypothetical protein
MIMAATSLSYPSGSNHQTTMAALTLINEQKKIVAPDAALAELGENSRLTAI